jgi:5'-methylthioadenosine nucleosidase
MLQKVGASHDMHAGLKSGVVSTGNSLGFVSEDLELMHSANTAVKDMESAAVAYVCRLWQTPMLAIKAVTDIVDGDKATTEEFLANLQKSSAALQDVVCKVLQFMQGKRLVDL